MGIRTSVPSVRLMMVRGGGGKKGAAANRASGNSANSPSSDQNEEVTKYILHEEWLADVCGVSRRRLTIRTEAEMQAANPCQNLTNNDIDEMPTQDELQVWSKSFEKLMQSSRGRRLFLAFLRSEYSEENMHFWLACEDLKEEGDPEKVEEKVRLIYEDFISILSPREVSLDGKARDLINRNMSRPDRNTFDDAQIQIYTLMQRDSYPRFLASTTFRELLVEQ